MLPLTTAAPIWEQLSEEPVIEWLIRWDGSAHTEGCPGSTNYYLTELRERPLPEAAPPLRGAATCIQ